VKNLKENITQVSQIMASLKQVDKESNVSFQHKAMKTDRFTLSPNQNSMKSTLVQPQIGVNKFEEGSSVTLANQKPPGLKKITSFIDYFASKKISSNASNKEPDQDSI